MFKECEIVDYMIIGDYIVAKLRYLEPPIHETIFLLKTTIAKLRTKVEDDPFFEKDNNRIQINWYPATAEGMEQAALRATTLNHLELNKEDRTNQEDVQF